MRAALAVARVDIRRFGRASALLGLVGAIAVAVASLAATDDFDPKMLYAVAFLLFPLAGSLLLGNLYGREIASGRAAFFFARPVHPAAVVLGRLFASLVLSILPAAMVTVASRLFIGGPAADELGKAGIIALLSFAALWSAVTPLSCAAWFQGERPISRRVVDGLCSLLAVASFALVMGMFIDVTLVRTFDAAAKPRLIILLFALGPLLLALFSTVRGRSDGRLVVRYMTRASLVYGFICATMITAIWSYVLHPQPRTAEGVKWVVPLPDGFSAQIVYEVHRLTLRSRPSAILNLTTGEVSPLLAHGQNLPIVSRTGRASVGSDDGPHFHRPFKALFQAGPVRHRGPLGVLTMLPLPLSDPETASGFRWDLDVPAAIVSDDGEWIFYFSQGLWSVAHGAANLKAFPKDAIQAATFMPRALRTARLDPANRALVFEDRALPSGTITGLASLQAVGRMTVRFSRDADRAIVIVSNAQDFAVWLVDLQSAATFELSPSLPGRPVAIFLEGGALSGGVALARRDATGGVRAQFFGPGGGVERTSTDLGQINGPTGLIEVDSGLVALSHGLGTDLIDVSTGTRGRSFPNLRPLGRELLPRDFDAAPPPPGSPGSRIFTLNREFVILDPSTGKTSSLLTMMKGK